jgi:hypothetical protein
VARDARLGKLEGEVAETADADDADLLSGPAAVALERRVDGQAGAHERGSVDRRQGVGDLEDKVLVAADVGAVAALGGLAVLVLALVGEGEAVIAVGLVAVQAGLARAARVDLRADADTVADLELARGLLAELRDLANDLVADDAGVWSRKASRSVRRSNVSEGKGLPARIDVQVTGPQPPVMADRRGDEGGEVSYRQRRGSEVSSARTHCERRIHRLRSTRWRW